MNPTIEALSTLSTSVPEWNTRLDELNGQIALRQIELARLEERPPTARSVRNKGSTESLRPKDGDENLFLSNAPDVLASNEPAQSPRQKHNGFPPAQRPSSSTIRAAAVTSPPPSKANSNPRPSPNALTRQSSQPTPPAHARPGPVLRTRKTESLASGESLVPRRKTRSMIIVYYDSAVQTAFEDLVKFVSRSRNALRKGKMAVKMAEMKRAAELDVERSDEEDGSDAEEMVMSGNLATAHRKLRVGREEGGTPAANAKPVAEISLPDLRFVSTRQMGPGAIKPRIPNTGSQLSFGLMRNYRRSGGEGAGPDIFEELDKVLEWCQSECERAAHQFLRDGECGTEIENIKKKLLEVQLGAEQEMEKLKALEENPEPVRRREPPEPRDGASRGLKPIQMRRGFEAMKDVEVDESTNMEVDDDEGVDDLEPPKLLFKRSRDI